MEIENSLPDIDFSKASPNDLWEHYKDDLNNKHVNEIVTKLNPTINYTLSSLGAFNDPLIKTKAKAVTAKAVKKYDPSFGASLPTYVTSQLQQLNREYKNARSPIKIPEAQMVNYQKLKQAETEFWEENNREPSVDELADYSGIPIKTITKIRSAPNLVSEGRYGQALEGFTPEFLGEEVDYLEESIDYVYRDLDYKDKKLIEYATGFGGSDILSNKEIGEKLGISNSQISRRMAKLLLRIEEVSNTLKSINE